MGYKIKDMGIRKISVPIMCNYGNCSKEFKNGVVLAETAFDCPYEIKDITVSDNKIIVFLTEMKEYSISEPTNWIGEEAVCYMPKYDKNEEWVKDHIEQFGEGPSFF